MNAFSKSSICLLFSAALLFSFGLLMVFNTTAAEIIDRAEEMSMHTPLLRQISFALIGLLVGMVLYRIGYERLLALSPLLLVGFSLLLALVLVPGIGVSINGARRWFSFFGLSFQPSECTKILLPASFIYWATSLKKTPSVRDFLKVLAWLLVPVGLILFEPDNGTVVVLMALLVTLFFLTKMPLSYWALPLVILSLMGALFAYNMPHVQRRIEVYLHPELDLRGKGHQPHQAKIAAGSGGLFGRGIGESLQKMSYLPEARSDYIAAIYAEETGFLGIVLLIGLYLLFSYAGFFIALQAKDLGGFLLAASATMLVSLQAFLNLGVVSAILPSKGMTLPFFSQGGTSLMVHFISLFLLLDIARKSKEMRKKAR